MSAYTDYRKEHARETARVMGVNPLANYERYYYRELRKQIRFVVPDGGKVLCVQCGDGQYLDWVNPARGIGIDLTPERIEAARERYPAYEFQVAAPEAFESDETFDTILVANAINSLFDLQDALENLRRFCTPRTRIVFVWHNFLWKPFLDLAHKMGKMRPLPPQNWLSLDSVLHILHVAGFDAVRSWSTMLCPAEIPGLSWLLNDVLAGLPLLEELCLNKIVVARTMEGAPPVFEREPTVSVIVPCKNERGNVEGAVLRTPEMGSHTEIIFCDDKSTDGTPDEVRRMQTEHPDRDIRLVNGPGICKAANVWTGFDAAKGDILMILDGDLAVPPEELPKFYRAIVSGKGEFVNGTRLIYPMRDQAMRLANVFGNKMFSLLFSHILRERVSDTLCGTKVLWREDYERLKEFRNTWGIDDRWGDYELIFGSARLNQRYLEIPVHYMERQYGVTKMTGRLRNAARMLRMCLAAWRKFR